MSEQLLGGNEHRARRARAGEVDRDGLTGAGVATRLAV